MRAHSAWIRIAVNGPKIKSGDPRGWRCFVDPDITEHSVTGCVISGTVNPTNCITETNKERDVRGLVGWIRLFGNIRIENDVAYIDLAEPERP